jgi:hypothetical protein
MRFARNRIFALIAMGAMALNALWPLISQAQPRDPALYATICSVQGGVQTIDLSGGGIPADHDGGRHQKHCKLCVAAGDRLQALLPAPVVPLRIAGGTADTPVARPAAAPCSTSDSPALPRAPPSHA